MIKGDTKSGSGGPSRLGGQRPPSCAHVNQNMSLEKKPRPNIISGIQLDRLSVVSLFGSMLNIDIELTCCS